MITRRAFLATAACPYIRAAVSRPLRIGATDAVLRQSGNPEAIAVAARVGVAGLQVTISPAPGEDRLPLEEPELQERYRAESVRRAVPLNATYLAVLQSNCLKNDARGRDWIIRGIDVTRRLQAGVMMIAMFGNCQIASRDEQDYVAGVLREL